MLLNLTLRINLNAQDVNGRTHFRVDVEIVF